MPEEEKNKQKAQKIPQPITRREFALGSMAMLGAYSLTEAATLPPLPAEAQAMKLEINDTVRSYMETRHILEDDLKRVIDHAEKTGQKLYEPETNRFLSKLRVQEVYFYAEYSPTQEGFQIHDAYSHRFLLAGDK